MLAPVSRSRGAVPILFTRTKGFVVIGHLSVLFDSSTEPQKKASKLFSGWWFFTNPFEKICSSNWVKIFPKVRGEHKKSFKPPSSFFFERCHAWSFFGEWTTQHSSRFVQRSYIFQSIPSFCISPFYNTGGNFRRGFFWWLKKSIELWR